MIASLLIKHESLELKAYKDTKGKITIGVGRNLDDKGISRAEAMILLQNDIMEARKNLAAHIRNFNLLNEPRQGVLVNMHHNLGMAGLLRFKKMLAAIERLDWNRAASEILDSKAARNLSARYNELADIMRSGAW